MQDQVPPSTDMTSQRDLVIGSVAAICTMALGGYLCALAVDRFGEMGGVSFWLLGWVAGSIAKALMSRPRKQIGYAMAISVVMAMLIAEVCWIRWNIKDVDSWSKAVSLFPQFCREYQISVISAALFTFFAASSAYSQAGKRYRLVEVVED